MFGNAGRVAVILAMVISGEGCTTLLYKGPTRTASEIAVVTSKDTIVDEVDDVMVRDHASGTYARLELLPGSHRIGISLNRVTMGFFATRVARSDDIVLCANLEAGHTYQTEALTEGSRFFPVVVDLTAQRQARRCRSEPRPAALAAAPVPREDQETPPPAPQATAVDAEEPIAVSRPVLGRAPVRERLPSDAVLAMRPPGSGFSLVLGLAFGGEEFVKATDSNGDEQSLKSGSGVVLGIGGMLTPLWVGETVGFGLGLDGAVKYDSLGASNGSASITRFPVSLTTHVLVNLSDSLHYLIVKGGVIRDFGVNYKASGFDMLDANLSGTWGPTGAIGYYKRSNDVFGWDILGFFALTKHVVGPQRINANAFGVSWGLHWRP